MTDWRYSAYLKRENWPDAIPWMGPKRNAGPYSWGRPTHDDPHDLDQYPHYHPDAASIGEMYLGDVCPYCGVPIRWDEEVVLLKNRERGIFGEISTIETAEIAYHADCWTARLEEKGEKITTLSEFR